MDSDEEPLSLAHHCEFRQAEVVLPHLPRYHSLTLNPLFYGPFPHTSDRGCRGWWRTCHSLCLHCLSPYYFFPLRSVSLFHSPFPPSVIFSPPPPLFSPLWLLFFFSCLVSLSRIVSLLLHLLSLIAPNSCCCARKGLKLNTSVEGEEKVVLCSSALQHFFFLKKNKSV